MNRRKEYLRRRIEIVRKIVAENYEPENQSRCKTQAYRRYVMPLYPMSERTFWRYMHEDVDSLTSNSESPKQLDLFPEK